MRQMDVRRVQPSRRGAGPPRGGRGGRGGRSRVDRSWLAAGLSLAGLVVVAFLTLALFGGQLPIGPPATLEPGATPTARPTGVEPAKRTEVLGTVLFAKDGNIWAAGGTSVRQLSTTEADSSPAWTSDGAWIYLIETRTKRNVSFPYFGIVSRYTLHYPVIVRMRPDGSEREDVADSLYTNGAYTYHIWYMQPTPDPKGRRIAVVSDGPASPIGRDPVIQVMSAGGGKLTNLGIPYTPPLGLGDPAWRSDGDRLAYTRYGREGFEPRHRIGIYNVETERTRALTGSGYSEPAWSPDGRFLAAVRWNGQKRDVVIISASDGEEVLVVTRDGDSWAPAWSPAGDAIVFLTASGLEIDLDLVPILRVGADLALGERLPITQHSLLDGTSRPSWYVPPELLPTPSPEPTASPKPAGTPPASPIP